MRFKRSKKILAVLLAALMVIAAIPVMNWGLNTAKADETTDTGYTLVGTDVGEKITANKESIGTNGYFSVLATEEKPVDYATNKKTFDGVDYLEVLKMGQGNIYNERAVKFTVAEGATATIKVCGIASGGTKDVNYTNIGLFDEAGTKVQHEKVFAGNTPVTTFDGIAAGTYYITDYKTEADGSDYKGLNLYALTVIPTAATPDEPAKPSTKSYALVGTDVGEKITANKESIGEESYFSVLATEEKPVDYATNKKTFDGVDYLEVLKMGQGNIYNERAVKFTVAEGATATIKVCGIASGGTKDVNYTNIGLFDEAGTKVQHEKVFAGNTPVTTFDGIAAGTYYITDYKTEADGGDYKGLNLYAVIVTQVTGGTAPEPPARKPWAEVAAPELGTITQDNADVKVPFTMVMGDDGADKVTVTMKDAAGATVDTKTYTTKTTTEGEVTFKPSDSGTYTFSIAASREGEEDKAGTDKTLDYVLPLTAPSIESALGDGVSAVTVEWKPVTSADKYVVSYKAEGAADYTKAGETTTETSYKVTGLTVGTKYTFKVEAVRTAPAGTSEATLDKTFTSEVERWKVAYVGTQAGSNESNGSVTVKEDGSVEIYASDGKFGSSNDGWIFYYTEVVSAEENFVYKAKLKLSATKDNQSGAGLMVADTIGRAGKRDLCSFANYILNGEAKIEFIGEDGVKTTYSNGYGIRKVTGATDPYGEKADGRTVDISNSYFNDLTSDQIITPANITAGSCQTELELTLVKDNNGYHASLANAEGKVISTYDPSKFLQQDQEKVYVGLAVSRGTRATFTNISFESRKPSDDPAKDESTWEKDYTPQNLFVYAGATTSQPEYNYRYYGNWDANVKLTDGKGNVLFSKDVAAGETISYDMTLTDKKTTLITTVTPDPEKVVLQSYEPVVIEKTVTMNKIGKEGETIIVTPNGSASGNGTEAKPLDIYTAVKYAQPGQVILLKNGTYDLATDLVIPFSVSGTKDKMITLMAEEQGKVKLDGSNADPTQAGQMIAVNGNYWHLYGLEICNSGKLKKGIQVSGNNNIIEFCDIHDNGTTGLQISRSGGEPKEWWPKNNFVKNCDSYNNCDVNYNDADGFGAKLTVGEGNKFYGCMAYNNIDDGWDLYAKNEAGQGAIAPVIVENCVAFNNGWIPGVEQTGEGNGFKLGGEGLPGAHQLINCVSFNNGAKGVASNNGPDCQVIGCTVYNNNTFYANDTTGNVKNSYNLSLSPLNGSSYNGTTNYVLKDTISLYTFERGQKDQIALVGQESLASDNVYLVNESLKSLNKSGAEATEAWFKSVDTSVLPTRNANGTINMHDLLVLNDASLTVGAKIVTTGEALSVAPQVAPVTTGDATPVALYAVLAVMSLIALTGAAIFGKKQFSK